MPIKVYRRGKVWHYRGTVAGRRLRGSCQTTDQGTAARHASQIEAREWKYNFDGPEAVLTFSQAALLYRSDGKSTRFLDRIEDHWKDTLVKDIKPTAIRQMAIALYPGTTGATMNRQAIVPCQAVINHAAEAELCPHIRVKRFKVEKKIKPPFTLEWVNAFCEHTNSPYLQALAIFMFATGARISEALAVEWHHVDLQARTIIIPKSKISEQRQVNLPPRLLVAVANLPKVKGRPIFWYRTSGNLRHRWETTIKRAKIQRMTPHSGRHGFATATLRSRKIDPKTAAWLGGWKSIRHFMETYAHAIQDITQNNVLFDTPLTQEALPEPKTGDKTGTC
jgi:integrase